MKGNKIAIDRYLETGEIVDSLDLSVNYLVKYVREGGTVPLPVINALTWSRVTSNPSPSDLMTETNTDTSIDFDTIVVPSGYPYLWKVEGSVYTVVDARNSSTPSFIGYLNSIVMPTTASVGNWAFSGCSFLTSMYMPNVKSIGERAFNNCPSLTSVELPKAESISANAFRSCSKIISVYLPKAISIGNRAFDSCSLLSEIVVGTETSVVCTLGTSVFPSTIQSIYVPDSLVDSYKSATNWSTFADKIKGISEKPTT